MASGAFPGSAAELLRVTTQRLDGVAVTGDRRTVSQAQGFAGVAVPIAGTNFSGAVTAFVQPATTGVSGGSASVTGVTVIVKGRPDTLTQLTDDIARMLASVRFTVRAGG